MPKITGPKCEGALGDPCAEGGPPMELARVIYACGCHCTHEEDAPQLLQAAPDMLAALRAVNDAYSFINGGKVPVPLVSAIRKVRRAIQAAGVRLPMPLKGDV